MFPEEPSRVTPWVREGDGACPNRPVTAPHAALDGNRSVPDGSEPGNLITCYDRGKAVKTQALLSSLKEHQGDRKADFPAGESFVA